MLGQIAIFLAAAVLAVPLFKRFGLGSVLGYLAAGVAIGPTGLGVVNDVEQLLHFAEFGVVLLLFIIGLELQPARLWRMRGGVFGVGGAQVALTTLLVALAAYPFLHDLQASLIVGFGLSLSSTAFATQILSEKNELATQHGRRAFGILLFQDVAAIPALAVLPMLASKQVASSHPMWQRIAIAAGVIVLLVLAGRYLLRPAFRFVAMARSHELSTASALLVVVGTSLLMYAVGLSMALGAFLAGVLLADSEYRHELEANLEPFKGLLLGLFFMAVGMTANLDALVEHPVAIVGAALALVLLKAILLIGIGRASRDPLRSSVSLGVAISQGGEFAFVLFGVAHKAELLLPAVAEALLMVITLSMCTTPFLFMLRDAWLKRVEAGEKREYDQISDDGSRVIIAGFGRFGQIIGRILRLRRINFTALDHNAQQVDFIRRFGNKIYYGDASRLDLLRAAGTDRAKLFVLAIDDMEASMRTLEVVQRNFGHVRIIARARNRQHAYALYGAGVEVVIRENFAGSLEAARLVLEELGLTGADARETVRKFGEYDEAMVKKVHGLRDDEKALIEAARQYAQELERIFEEDERAR